MVADDFVTTPLRKAGVQGVHGCSIGRWTPIGRCNQLKCCIFDGFVSEVFGCLHLYGNIERWDFLLPEPPRHPIGMYGLAMVEIGR